MYYYYHKDHFGKERVRRIDNEDLMADELDLLTNLGDPDFLPVTIIDGSEGCFDGYDSIDELVNDNVEPDEQPDDELMEYVSAVVAGIEAFGYPFALIEHVDESLPFYEVCPIEDIQWEELIKEFAEAHEFQINPCYFESYAITADEARERGMYALAEELEW